MLKNPILYNRPYHSARVFNNLKRTAPKPIIIAVIATESRVRKTLIEVFSEFLSGIITRFLL